MTCDVSRLQRIREKALRVEAALPRRTVAGKLPFGAGTHRYKLNLPAALSDVEAFEVKHAVRLPAGYREFLVEIEDGGAGPAYGVLPLRAWACHVREWDAASSSPTPRAASPSAPFLASPCPLRSGARYDDEWLAGFGPLEYHAFQGTMAVCSQGCADCILLIVTGEERGRLVSVGEDWNPPIFLSMPDFLGWYETWQDSVLGSDEIVWTGYPSEEAGELNR